ncbi:hypothetical protein N802_03400 [Knoellia sinensis KCTC 19936]|uniref:Haemophore haem-binding domain-containing protein n=1 Tax=Knoellia sinensis KCTC 19936 TaxID=1385520 RepID=A0A0A0J2V8_9MICO|nr:hypothetical protein [Knoellia sinensis]KGN31740.1 hypothetical protein N802_03400 [Knoellia sinensis KCTC 19936]
MRRSSRVAAVAALAITGTVVLATPAAAGPSPRASCVGQVFVPQATGDPGAIARRIAEIKGFIDIPWGQVVSDLLAHAPEACGRE